MHEVRSQLLADVPHGNTASSGDGSTPAKIDAAALNEI